ncbi:hypothetical protein SCLCIDRAFT_1225446 [Scleroderma citrinum Foug A]|uniref:Uncharacterized protein n=1 Tax=Scleroderma citrinum Foug A TaxID=1036808 RepID=A0A0C2YKI5_9AGAM|nr:hypothetical protein SCLCIDRAFT_1225446 [Scleroderma citrinum Foug A]
MSTPTLKTKSRTYKGQSSVRTRNHLHGHTAAGKCPDMSVWGHWTQALIRAHQIRGCKSQSNAGGQNILPRTGSSSTATQICVEMRW